MSILFFAISTVIDGIYGIDYDWKLPPSEMCRHETARIRSENREGYLDKPSAISRQQREVSLIKNLLLLPKLLLMGFACLKNPF